MPTDSLLKRALARLRRVHHVLLFVAVGSCAAALHWSVVVGLVESFGWQPLASNLAGWIVAMVVSFVGHYRLTFRGHRAPLLRSALRFVLVSGLGFAINQTAYALLLAGNARWYSLKLAAVLIGVALITYVLSRHWTFLRSAGN
ncbi:GtrA family protein [Acidovorax sp. SUPP2539]|uniref:GtrA family protein n=1 Tax=Acidovorax sp. SUPP2539 TaxID=2920878 RepID=UPI0024E13523|nr:GtrA family protein [Acidovorax sp. SUPP2539]